jgi:hypothetical protein
MEYYGRITIWLTPETVVCFMSIFSNPCHRFPIISINLKGGTDVNFFWGIHIMPISCELSFTSDGRFRMWLLSSRCWMFIFPPTNHLLWSCSILVEHIPMTAMAWQMCIFAKVYNTRLTSYKVMNFPSTIVHDMFHGLCNGISDGSTFTNT